MGAFLCSINLDSSVCFVVAWLIYHHRSCYICWLLVLLCSLYLESSPVTVTWSKVDKATPNSISLCQLFTDYRTSSFNEEARVILLQIRWFFCTRQQRVKVSMVYWLLNLRCKVEAITKIMSNFNSNPFVALTSVRCEN